MKILLIDAHPDEQSFCSALANEYVSGANESNHEIKVSALRELAFEPILKSGYREKMEMEEALLQQQELIKWCEHLVLITPVWWMGVPALLKGYFDRVLLPGFAFKYHEKDPFWDRLLAGRSARVIYTQDAPQYFQLIARWDCFWKSINQGSLGFCGFKPVKRTVFSMVKDSSDDQRKKWLSQVYALGSAGK